MSAPSVLAQVAAQLELAGTAVAIGIAPALLRGTTVVSETFAASVQIARSCLDSSADIVLAAACADASSSHVLTPAHAADFHAAAAASHQEVSAVTVEHCSLPLAQACTEWSGGDVAVSLLPVTAVAACVDGPTAVGTVGAYAFTLSDNADGVPCAPRSWLFQGRHGASATWRTLHRAEVSGSDQVHAQRTCVLAADAVGAYAQYRLVIIDVFASSGNMSKRVEGAAGLRVSSLQLYAPGTTAMAAVDWGWILSLSGPAGRRRLRVTTSDGSIDAVTVLPLQQLPGVRDVLSAFGVQLCLRYHDCMPDKASKEGVVEASLMVNGTTAMLVSVDALWSQALGAGPPSGAHSLTGRVPQWQLHAPVTALTLGGLPSAAASTGRRAFALDADGSTLCQSFHGKLSNVVYSAEHEGDVSAAVSAHRSSLRGTPAPAVPAPLPVAPPMDAVAAAAPVPVPALTRAAPFRTLEHVLLWQPDADADAALRCSVPYRWRAQTTTSGSGSDSAARRVGASSSSGIRRALGYDGPYTLVCHDCGPTVYAADADTAPQVGDACSATCAMPDETDSSRTVTVGMDYRFEAWPWCDVFVYFSHARVTIPPPGWIAAGHAQGVRVLGTLIWEWDDGAAGLEALLEPYLQTAAAPTAPASSALARQLAAIAAWYGFDGWLLNVEAPLRPATHTLQQQVAALTSFVADLTQCVHAAVPDGGGLVLWYDSVDAHTGAVWWRSALTHCNAPFLAACDGLFTDYHWSTALLEGTARAAAVGAGRSGDIFVGIDVWGRGTPGGGGWGCRSAVDAIRAAAASQGLPHLSIALFAPAWTWEAKGGSNSLARFRALEQRMWTGSSSMQRGRKATGATDNLPELRQPVVINADGLHLTAESAAVLAATPAALPAVQLHGWEAAEGSGSWSVAWDDAFHSTAGKDAMPDAVDEADPEKEEEVEVEAAADSSGTKRVSCFVTSHAWCTASQLVPLTLPAPVPGGVKPVITVSEWYCGTGPNHEDSYRFRADLVDAAGASLAAFDSGVLTTTVQWQRIQHSFEAYPDGVSGVRLTHAGKDAEHWAGHYGARMRGAAVRLHWRAEQQSAIANTSATTGTEQGDAAPLDRGGLAGGLGMVAAVPAVSPLLPASAMAIRPAAAALPFRSTFDTGLGDAMYREGAICKLGPWVHLMQAAQPFISFPGPLSTHGLWPLPAALRSQLQLALGASVHTPTAAELGLAGRAPSLSLTHATAYEGGTSVLLTAALPAFAELDGDDDCAAAVCVALYRLFAFDLPAAPTSIVLCYRPHPAAAGLSLLPLVCSPSGALVGYELGGPATPLGSSGWVRAVHKLPADRLPPVAELYVALVAKRGVALAPGTRVQVALGLVELLDADLDASKLPS